MIDALPASPAITIPRAVLLGLIQGITEFLPVSSSGHLVFFQSFVGLEGPMLAFDAMLHFGTLMALVFVFRRELVGMVRRVLGGRGADSEADGEMITGGVAPDRMIYLIIVGSIPTGIIGYLLKERVEGMFASPAAAGLMLMVTGVVLLTTRFSTCRPSSNPDLTAWKAVMVGAAQGLAVTPGISRSGVTISAGLHLGLERQTAAVFSFLLSIPIILAATLISLPALGGIALQELLATLCGAAVAAFSGYVSLRIVLRVVRMGRLHRFAPYCLVVGGIMFFA